MIRLFVALDLPGAIKHAVDGLCYGLPGARWTAEDQLHLTLAFIGDVDPASFEEIRRDLGAVRGPALSLRLKGLGVFPPRGRPQVLWVGVEAGEPLYVLQKRVERTLARAGIAPEYRRYSPHVTLTRLKETPEKLVGAYLGAHALFKSEPFDLTSFQLFSSVLTPDGAEHSIEEHYPLEENGGSS